MYWWLQHLQHCRYVYWLHGPSARSNVPHLALELTGCTTATLKVEQDV